MELEIENAAPALPAAQATPEPAPPTSFQDRALTYPILARYTPAQGNTLSLAPPWGSAGSGGGWNGKWSGPVGEIRHPVHGKWTEADFERLYRFDENRDRARNTKDDWSHPAHVKRIQRLAATTPQFWRVAGPPIKEEDALHVFKEKIRGSVRQTLDLLRQQTKRESRLDFGVSSKCQHEFECEENYKEDGRLKTRKIIGLFDVVNTGTRKTPLLVSDAERIRKNYKEYESALHTANGTAPVKQLSRYRIRLDAEEQRVLQKASLDETSPFAGEPTKDVQIDPRPLDKQLFGGSLTRPDKKAQGRWNKKLEKLRKQKRLDVSVAPLGEIIEVEPQTHEHANMEEERNKLRLKYNPQGVPQLEVDAVVAHPDFQTDVQGYHVLSTNTPLKELGVPSTNALSKRFVRPAKPIFEFSKVKGHWFCVVILNNRPHIKKLAPLAADPVQVYQSFQKECRKSKVSAAKEERRKSNRSTLTKRLKEASERIQIAYANTWIFNGDTFESDFRYFVTDTNNRLLFEGLRIREGGDVTDFPINVREAEFDDY